MMVQKFLSSLLVFICIYGCNPNNANLNELAKKKIEEQFLLIEQFNKNELDSSYKVTRALLFFQEITSIQSEADITFLGKISPTEADVKRWRKWYRINAHKVRWDQEKNKIILQN